MIRKDITEDIIYKTVVEVYEENNRDISIKKLFELACKKLNCTINLIKCRYGNFNDILKELNINIPKSYKDLKTRKNIVNGHIRKELTKEAIYKTIIEVYEINNNVCIIELFKLVAKKLNCNIGTIRNRCGNFDETLKKLNINIPKYFYNSESKKNISEGLKNSGKFQKSVHSKERSEKISKVNTKNIFLENIGQNLLNKVKYEGLFSINEFRNDDVHRDFGKVVINRVLRENNITIEDLAKQKGVELLPRANHWKAKEQLGIELCKELYGEGKIKQYYNVNGKMAFPDFSPDNILIPIFDIKSTTGDIRIEQNNKYNLIRGETRVMVFEDKGKTELPSDRIMYMKEIIKSLPDSKRLIFQEKFERIKNNIPLEQMTLKDFEEKEVKIK